MSSREQKADLPAVWQGIHGGVWLLGLAILFYTGWWWPGILILVGVSSIVQAIGHAQRPDIVPPPDNDWDDDEHPQQPPLVVVTETPKPAAPAFQFDLSKLPNRCPSCGAPVTRASLRPVDDPNSPYDRPACSYCGTILTA